MSTATATPVPAHPLTAGTTPALLWLLAQCISLAAQAGGVLLAFWFSHQLAVDALTVMPLIAAFIVLYAACFPSRWLIRTAQFHTPGGLVLPANRHRRQRVLAQTPGWVRHALGYALALVLAHWLLHTPAAATPVTAIAPTVTTADVFILGLVPAATVVLIMDTARAIRHGIITRSWLPLIDPAITAAFAVAAIMVALPVVTPDGASVILQVTIALAIAALALWITVVVLRRPSREVVHDNVDLAGRVLTWWHGAPTLEDRRRYTPWIKAAAIVSAALLGLIALSPVALT